MKRLLLAALTVTSLPTAVSSCADDDSPTGSVVPATVIAADYRYSGLPATASRGDTLNLTVVNQGGLRHNLEISTPTGQRVARLEAIGPGSTATLSAHLTEVGRYRVICDVDDHLVRGMKATIEVTTA